MCSEISAIAENINGIFASALSIATIILLIQEYRMGLRTDPNQAGSVIEAALKIITKEKK